MTNTNTKSKKWRLTMRNKEMLTGYMFILPAMIGLALFFFPMLAQVVRYSFSDIYIPFGERYQLLSRGWDHYHTALFVHPTYVRLLTETVIDLVWNVPLIIFFSLFMAILLNKKIPGRLVFRALFFLPVVLAIPAIQNNLNAMTEMMQGGIATTQAMEGDGMGFDIWMIGRIMRDFGMPYAMIDFIMGAVMRLHVVVRSSGVQMIIFLAALQAIPASLYEVAQVEGATPYETFWKITLPMVSPLILTNVVYTIVDNYVRSAPLALAHDLTMATAARNFGLSATFSLLTALVMTILILISGLIISRKVFYQT